MHHNGHMGELRPFSHLLVKVPAIHAGHPEVEEYHTQVFDAIDGIERLLAILRSYNRIPVQFEHVAHHLAKLFFVFDQEDRMGHGI